jgi:hypothetical protein
MFPGNSDIDMFYLISSTLGNISTTSSSSNEEWNEWKDGLSLCLKLNLKLPTIPNTFSSTITSSNSPITKEIVLDRLRLRLDGWKCEQGLVLLRDLLRWDPNKRPNISALLNYTFLTDMPSQRSFYTAMTGSENVKPPSVIVPAVTKTTALPQSPAFITNTCTVYDNVHDDTQQQTSSKPTTTENVSSPDTHVTMGKKLRLLFSNNHSPNTMQKNNSLLNTGGKGENTVYDDDLSDLLNQVNSHTLTSAQTNSTAKTHSLTQPTPLTKWKPPLWLKRHA